MVHDLLFKQLLRTYFVEFLELFFPKLHRHIDPASVEFLDKEIISDLPKRIRREADLLVRVRYKGKKVFFLIHLEHQHRREPGFAKRMLLYFAYLFLHFDLPVYPIAVFSYDSPSTVEPDRYRIEFPGRRVLDFRFATVQLNRLDWRKFVRKKNPVAAALMTRMKIKPQDHWRVKLECLRMMATLKLEPGRAELIREFMTRYLVLSGEQSQLLRKEVDAMPVKQKERVLKFTNEWRQEGEKLGRQEGRQELVERLLRKRFGTPADSIAQACRSLTSARLDAFAEAMFDFTSLDDARRWLEAASN